MDKSWRPRPTIIGGGISVLAWVIEMANIPISDYLLVILGAVGVCMILYGILPLVPVEFHNYQWIRMWNLKRRDPFPFRRIMPLGEAARIAYEKLRDTETVKITHGLNPDDPLGAFYHRLTMMPGAQIFGCHPPSTILDHIPTSEFNFVGHFSDDGSTFTLTGQQTPNYERLSIRKADLQRYIKEHRD